MKGLFKPKLFSRVNRSVDQADDPMERSEVLYRAGKDKLLKLNESMSKSRWDENSTFKP